MTLCLLEYTIHALSDTVSMKIATRGNLFVDIFCILLYCSGVIPVQKKKGAT